MYQLKKKLGRFLCRNGFHKMEKMLVRGVAVYNKCTRLGCTHTTKGVK